MTIRTQILQLNQDKPAIIALLRGINAQTLQDPRVMQAVKTLIDELIFRLGNEIGAKKQALKQYVTREFSNLAMQYPDDDLSFTLSSQNCGVDLKQLATRIQLYNQLIKNNTDTQIDTIAETLAHEDLEVTPVTNGLNLSLKR